MKSFLSRLFDIIGKIIAVVLVFAFLLYYLNVNFNFLPAPALIAVNAIKEWGALLLIAVTGVEAVIKRNIVFIILFLLVLAAVIVFMFFPHALESLGWFQPKSEEAETAFALLGLL